MVEFLIHVLLKMREALQRLEDPTLYICDTEHVNGVMAAILSSV